MLKTLRTFYKHALHNKALFGVLLVLIAATSIGGSAPSFFYKLFVDAITAGRSNTLVPLLTLFIGIRIATIFLNTSARMVGDYLLRKSASDLRIAIFKHLQDLDMAYHVNKSTGSLISAMKRGDGAFISMFITLHFDIFYILVSFGALMFYLSRVHPIISLTTVVFFTLSLIASKFIVAKNIRARVAFNREEDRVSAVIVDNLISFETVKLFAKEKWERARLARVFEDWKKRYWDYIMSFRFFDISIGSIVTITLFINTLIALGLVESKQIGVGDFVLVIGSLNYFYPKLFDLVWNFREIAKHYSDMVRYFAILDVPIEVKDPVNPVNLKNIKGEIKFDKVRFSYKGGKKNAVRGISLSVREGQSIALVGRSGCGKTTMVKLLMRFYDLEAGTISIDKVNITNLTKSRLRSFIGVVPQEPILFDNTIAYNIAYGAKNPTRKEIESAAKIASIHDFIMTLPKAYETKVGERGIKLSGGQKQRLAIARVVLANPAIIVFDEATSQLDSESEKAIQEALARITHGRTTIIIAHRLSTVMSADKIVVMDQGKIVEQGSHSLLISQPTSLYNHFWDLQLKKADKVLSI